MLRWQTELTLNQCSEIVENYQKEKPDAVLPTVGSQTALNYQLLWLKAEF